MDQFNQAPAPSQEEFDDLETTVGSLSDSLGTVSTRLSNAYFKTFRNVGAATEIVITSTDTEQVYFIYGAAGNNTAMASVIQTWSAGTYVLDLGNAKPVVKSKSGYVVTITVPQWYRGCILSYAEFTALNRNPT